MILMIWSSARATECARIIEDSVRQQVLVVETLHDACERLRSEEYSAVVLDQWITESEPDLINVLFDQLRTAVPVFVNFGISGIDRVVREVRAALSRHGLETIMARHNARLALRDELKDDVTALLLSCGIALQDAGLVEATAIRFRTIAGIANQIKTKLAASEEESAASASG